MTATNPTGSGSPSYWSRTMWTVAPPSAATGRLPLVYQPNCSSLTTSPSPGISMALRQPGRKVNHVGLRVEEHDLVAYRDLDERRQHCGGLVPPDVDLDHRRRCVLGQRPGSP